jgi:glutaredoxin
MRSRILLVGLALAVLVALFAASGWDWRASVDSLSEATALKPTDSAVETIAEGKATQIYYQFIDDRNQVRFVASMDLVPEQWRSRVGYVELPSPPPMTTQDVQRTRSAQAQRRATRVASNQGNPQIIFYSADWCFVCRSAKSHMDSEGIAYEERNVDEPRYEAMLVEVSGARSIPVFDIDGNILSGFDPEKLDRLIATAI